MSKSSFDGTPLAIVGLGCRLPGADNADEYWRLLIEGRSAIAEVPSTRLNADIFYHPAKGVLGKSYTRLGGVVPDRPFDRQAVPISDELAAASDSSHLTMLEVAADALHDAGLDPFSLPERNVGVYIGHSRGSALAGDLIYSTRVEELAQMVNGIEPFDSFTAEVREKAGSAVVERVRSKVPHRGARGEPDVTANAAARVITQAFGLQGPYQAIDAACASALFSLAAAARALQQGRIDMAIAGSASYSSWFSLVLFSQAQALSARGSFPFDRRADGFISSDGYAAVIVKTLKRAVADGDRIYAVIRGIGVSSDGRGKSLWAPRTEGQVAAFERAYAGELDPSRLEYIEAHGTSTQLGDATEAESIATVLGRNGNGARKIPVASVKANIGHTCESAGLAGLVKTVLALKHRVIPGTINFAEPSEQIDWEKVPFFVPTESVEWGTQNGYHTRFAGVNSFGIGGLNAHVALEEHVAGTASSISVILPEESGAAESVAIVGMGAVFPGARTLEAFTRLVESRRKVISEVPPQRWDPELFCNQETKEPYRSPTRFGGFISDFSFDWRRHKIPPKQIETADPLHYMLLDAADQALAQAGYGEKGTDHSRTAVIVGTMLANDFFSDLSLALRIPEFEAELAAVLAEQGLDEEAAEEVVAEFHAAFEQRNRTLVDETGGFSSSTLASSMARVLDMKGGAFTIDSGEASSFAALAAAEDMLLNRNCDAVLCAGGQRYMGIDAFEWYGLRGLLTPAGSNGASNNGVVLGEGVGALLLKRLSDALRDGDRVCAVVRQVSGSSDTDSIEGAVHATLKKSVGSAGGQNGKPGRVEVVTTGVPELASSVGAAVAAGGSGPRIELKPDSVTEQMGHMLGASGMASLIATTLDLQNAGSEGEVGVLSCSLSGLAFHALLSPSPARATAAETAAEWRIIRLSADSRADLPRRLAGAADEAQSLFEGGIDSDFRQNCGSRVAIVADSPEALAQKLRLAAASVHQPAAQDALGKEGIFIGSGSQRPRIAFMFPGQGSQYDGMLRELIAASPAAEAKLQEINRALASLGHPTFEQIVLREGANLANDVWATQMSVFMADTIVYAAITALGIKPDVVVGHSFGEYPAMLAAGVWDLEQALRVTDARCRQIQASERCQGVLMATTATPEVFESHRAGVEGMVCLANHNAPDQTVFGGDPAAVGEVDRRLVAAGYQTRALPVPRPFHTPLMADVQEPLRKVLEAASLLPARVPLLSSVTNRYVSDPIEIRDNLVTQLTRPIYYVALVERLRQDGITALVEVGPRQVLTNLHRRILGTSSDATLVPCDNPKSPGLEQLLRVRAALECAGLRLKEPSEGPVAAGSPAVRSGSRNLAPVVHFDATQRRRQHMREQGDAPAFAQKPAGAQREPSNNKDELESFLVQFICEQTGYPPEVVQLDADLEADLGIDSLKKAQLFGEIREQFNISIQSTGRLKLEDFPTLRHVLSFLQTHGAKSAGGGLQAEVQSTASHRQAGPASAKSAETGQPIFVHSAGTAYEIGKQQAREQAGQIVDLLRATSQLPGAPFVEAISRSDAEASAYLSELGLKELQGMADELKCPVHDLILYNGRIVGCNTSAAPGCAQVAVCASLNGEEAMLHGAAEDWPMALQLGNNLPRTTYVRRPAHGIAHILFGIPGQLGGVNGVNAKGIAVTSAYLLDRQPNPDAPGLLHTVVVKTILEQAEDLDSAIEIVKGCKRHGCWSMCISHAAADRLCRVEYDPTTVLVEECKRALGTNHSVLSAPEGEVPQHSRYRLERLKQLLPDEAATTWSAAALRSALRDRFDIERQREATHPTMNTVLRVDNQLSVVMRPGNGEVWLKAGSTADAGAYSRLDLTALFGPAPDSDQIHADAGGRVMSRFVLRTREVPLVSRSVPPQWSGAALVVGEDATAAALRKHLTALGARVAEVPAGGGLNDWLDNFERAYRESKITHLFLTLAREAGAACGGQDAAWGKRRERGLVLPYLLCQRWTKLLADSGVADQATLAAVTGLGGDFGLSGTAGGAEGGGMAGLLKSIRREFPKMVIKAIDAPMEEPAESLAATVCGEIVARTREVEVGYVQGRRRIVYAVPRAAARLRDFDIRQGSNWVISGGARGITALVTKELCRRYGLRVHLIGTTPAEVAEELLDLSGEQLQGRKLEMARQAQSEGRDPTADWARLQKAIQLRRHLRDLEQSGAHAVYHQCDVSDVSQVARVLEQARKDGPISGIIHGAGVEQACRYENKRIDSVQATMAAKVDGAAALISLTEQDPIEWFLAFGSVVGRFGGLGQTDYGMASDMLSKQVQYLRAHRPGCRAVTFDWPAWDEAGMSVRPETRIALETGGFRFMPSIEGVEHIIDEIGAGAPEGEVIILDHARDIDLDGIMPSWNQRTAFLEAREKVRELPLIDGVRQIDGDRCLTAEASFDARVEPFLIDHRFQNVPLLPSVAGMEALAETARLLAGGAVAALREVEIVNACRFARPGAHRFEIAAARDESGLITASLSAEFFNRQGVLVDPRRVYLNAVVEVAASPEKLEAPPLDPCTGEWHAVTYPDSEQALQQNLVAHGPALARLREVALEENSGWGRMVAPGPNEIGGAREGVWIIPAAALDSCLVACAVHARQFLGVRQLPSRFHEVRIGKLPEAGKVCTVRFWLKERLEDVTTYDFILYDAHNTPILVVKGHHSAVLTSRVV